MARTVMASSGLSAASSVMAWRSASRVRTTRASEIVDIDRAGKVRYDPQCIVSASVVVVDRGIAFRKVKATSGPDMALQCFGPRKQAQRRPQRVARMGG